MLRKQLKTCLNLLAFVMLLVIAIAGCSKDEKCYTCEGYSGSLPQTVSNICGMGPGGEPLVNYYINMGYHCYESKSASKSTSSITGPDEDSNIQIQGTETDNSDCPCKRKKENDNIILESNNVKWE